MRADAKKLKEKRVEEVKEQRKNIPVNYDLWV